MSRIYQALARAAVDEAGAKRATGAAAPLPAATVRSLSRLTGRAEGTSGALAPVPQPVSGGERRAAAQLRPDENRHSRATPLFTGFAPSVLERLVVGLHYRNKATMTMSVEQYRKVAATLLEVQNRRGIGTVMITSGAAGEGKTLSTLNLALTLSESYERRVLVIDADLARPTLHRLFQVPNISGLSDGLREGGTPKVWPLVITRKLALLPAGIPPADPSGMLASPRMWRVVREARARFDWVLVDVPPVGPLPDVSLLGKLLDAVLFVVDAGATDRAVAQRAVQALGRQRVLGVVLNRVEPPARSRL